MNNIKEMNLDFTTDIFLENEHVILSPLKVPDHQYLLGIALEDKNLLQYSPKQIYSPNLLSDYIQGAVNDRKNKLRYPFIIFDKMYNEYAGSTSFLAISEHDRRLEIGGTWIGHKFQKTGLNRNCKYLLMEYVFEQLEFERIEFKTDERNNGSRNAIEKIGGKFEGIFRSHMVLSDGFRRNTVYYSMLRNEWFEIKKKILRNI
jgi:RimJ/RimL family protein N-acetyltransferase